jgi:hypothetical protein
MATCHELENVKQIWNEMGKFGEPEGLKFIEEDDAVVAV